MVAATIATISRDLSPRDLHQWFSVLVRLAEPQATSCLMSCNKERVVTISFGFSLIYK